jgi:hypothetical protein
MNPRRLRGLRPLRCTLKSAFATRERRAGRGYPLFDAVAVAQLVEPRVVVPVVVGSSPIRHPFNRRRDNFGG